MVVAGYDQKYVEFAQLKFLDLHSTQKLVFQNAGARERDIMCWLLLPFLRQIVIRVLPA
jgi:hypothetical protein